MEDKSLERILNARLLFVTNDYIDYTCDRYIGKAKSKIRDNTVIFPTSDIYLLLITDLINDLNGYHIPIPKRKTIEILINKRKFYQSLIQRKIQHPITYFPENLKK